MTPDRRNILIALGAAFAVPAGLYGIPRLLEMAERQPREGPFLEPLSKDEQALVATMAEGIIPKTDTPGAIGAGVPAFMAMIFAEWLLPEEQAAFRAGLSAFQNDARLRFGRDFLACSLTQQTALLVAWDKAASNARKRQAKTLPPFAQFKALTVIGYYTSQVGQDQELKVEMDAGQGDPNGPVMMPIPFNL